MQATHVIVGAGTAGCVLANRLSADPANRVVLLEAGQRDNYFWIPIPVGYLFTIGNPRTDWCFQTTEQPGLNGRSIGYARGKVLGGCSSINAMIYMRGQASDYDHWAQLGNRGWGWDDVLPVFKASEDYAHGADAWHGADGELRVEERRMSWPILDAWRDAAAQSGIPPIDEFNRGDNEGCAYFQVNQRRGMRWSAVRAFLDPVRGRSNLTVLTEAHANHLVLEQAANGALHATGVNATTPDGSIEVQASQAVVLAAGAIGSPHLLQASGIGPADLLQAHDVPVRLDLPGVGANLQDHLQVRTIWKVPGAVTLNRRARHLWGKAAMAIEYAVRRSGPLTMPPSQLGAFTRSSADQPAADMEWHVQPLSLDRFGAPLHRFDAITPSVCNLRPSSRGTVQLTAPDTRTAPAIDPNYLATDHDRAVAVAGLRRTREIMAAPALAPFQPSEYLPGPDVTDDAALAQAAGDLGTTIFHPVGTCRMGRDPEAVVDDRLRVHGVNGLRVIDASVMPTITSGNTNAPTVMIAEQGARFLREDTP